MLSANLTYGNGDQTLYGLSAQSLETGLADAAPASAYNSSANEYFVLYVKTDIGCSDQRLFGQVLQSTTGNKVGSEFLISNCHLEIKDIKVVFNPDQNEYLIFYKSLGNFGDKSKLFFTAIDASTFTNTLSPTVLKYDEIGDPFRGLSLCYDPLNERYLLGYHEINALNESTLIINYLSSVNKSIQSYETVFSKDDFQQNNTGVLNTKLISAGTNVAGIFEFNLDEGSEIWGFLINPSNGQSSRGPFRISPIPDGDTTYINPSAYYEVRTNEIISVYEQCHFIDAEADFFLSDHIRVQKIDARTGEIIGETNVALPELPGSNQEDKKMPTVLASSFRNEILIAFYGVRFSAGSDLYNLYLHRLNSFDLFSISSSSLNIASGVGKEVLQNTTLKEISFNYNNQNNQFGINWFDESNSQLMTQIWRYDNNPPANLRTAIDEHNETLAIGQTFTTIDAEDPDPEDLTISLM
jgi:hypothetical protein